MNEQNGLKIINFEDVETQFFASLNGWNNGDRHLIDI